MRGDEAFIRGAYLTQPTVIANLPNLCPSRCTSLPLAIGNKDKNKVPEQGVCSIVVIPLSGVEWKLRRQDDGSLVNSSGETTMVHSRTRTVPEQQSVQYIAEQTIPVYI